MSGTPLPTLPVINPAVLQEHADALGPGFARQVVAKFLESAPATAAQVTRAAEAGDLKLLATHAHRLASGALTLGLPALNDLCRLAEHKAKSGATADAIAAGRKVEAALATAAAALTQFLDRLSAEPVGG